MISKRKFCIKNILKQNVRCKNPKVTWVVPESDCLTTPCEGCNDECIEISILEGCELNKIKVIVECPDCDDCPPIIDVVEFCVSDSDCGDCDKCDEGICSEKCPEDEYCDDNGNCVECLPGTCEDGKECINGKCVCPPNKVERDGECYDCEKDSHCKPCEVCVGNKCVAKECFNGVCDPETEECVDCIKSGDCGENEVCKDKECVCAPGFTFEPGVGCVPSPECKTDDDCGDCFYCSDEGCKERECPEGTICHEDDCVPLCDCDNPLCTGANKRCTEIKPNVCACIDGEPSPCSNKPCTSGEDCGPGCGCVERQCVDCSKQDCDTGECDEALGCECVGDDCIDSSTLCRGSCANGSDCGPGCGCLNGKCVPCSSFNCEECSKVGGCGCDGSACKDLEEECVDHFEIRKSDSRCALEARLITSNKCQCNRLSISSEVTEYTSEGATFKLQLKDGDADTEGIMNIPLLRDTGVVNYAPSSGRVNVKVIERDSSGGFGSTIYDQDYTFGGTDEIETDVLPINPREGITGIDVIFTVPKKSLRFDSGCSFSEEEEKITYKLNSVGRNGFIKYEDLIHPNLKYKVLESSDERTPIFTWYATSRGVETEVRTVYAKKISEGVYIDGWNSLNEGIRPGHYYRVESDCSCDKDTNLVCPGTSTAELLTYCNPKDITSKLVYTMSDCYKTITFDPVVNSFDICMASARVRQPFSLYLNGSEERSGGFLADPSTGEINIGGTFTSEVPIESFTLKLDGNNCDDCYEEVIIPGVDFEVEGVEYDCDRGKVNYSISGGGGNYRVYVGDDPTKKAENLPKGEHIITFEDVENGCKEEVGIKVDCCNLFEVDAMNVDYCKGEEVNTDIKIYNGTAPYDVTIIKDGEELAKFSTHNEDIKREIDAKEGTVTVSVKDSMGCTSEDVFRISEVSGPGVTINEASYCTGENTFNASISVSRPSNITIYNGDTTEYEGSLDGDFIVTLDVKTNKEYTVKATSGGCSTTKNFRVQELACPNPEVDTSDEDICPGVPIVVKAKALSGTPGYSWTIKHNGSELVSGEGSTVDYDTGILANEESYEFEIIFTDSKGKIGSGTSIFTLLDSDDQDCRDCPEPPNISIAGGNSKTVEVGQNVMLSHTQPNETFLSYSWVRDGEVVGTNKGYFFNATHQDIGTYSFVLKYEYAPGCFEETKPQEVTVTEEDCPDCNVSMKVVSGVPGLNGKTVNGLTWRDAERLCVGEEITLEAQLSEDCKQGGTQTVGWTVERWTKITGGFTTRKVKTGTGNTFTYTPTQEDKGSELQFRMTVTNGDCKWSSLGFESDVQTCLKDIPYDVTITSLKEDICVTDASSVPITFEIQVEKQGGAYDTFDPSWIVFRDGNKIAQGQYSGNWSSSGNVSITKNLDLTGGGNTKNIQVRVTRLGTSSVAMDDKDVTVHPINSIYCTSCNQRNTTISLDGISGNSTTITSGQYTNIKATASSDVETSYTYEWKGNGKTISGRTLSDNPTTDTQYTLTVTDSEGCETKRTISVKVEPACREPNPMSFAIFYDGYTGGRYEVCPEEEVTLTVSYDSTALPPTLYVNGSEVEIPQNKIVKLDMTASNMNIVLEGRFREDCDKKTVSRTIYVKEDCECELVSFGVTGDFLVCPGEPHDYTVSPNGLDSGYTYTWYSDPGFSSSIGTGEVLEGFSLSGHASETLYIEATKAGCDPVRSSVIVNSRGCNIGVGSIWDEHIYHPNTGEVELTTFRFSIEGDCGVEEIEKLVATYSGGITFDLKSNSTITQLPNGNYSIEATFPSNSRVPACTNGSDTVEGVDAEFRTSGGHICTLKRNFGKVCSETPGLPCNNC